MSGCPATDMEPRGIGWNIATAASENLICSHHLLRFKDASVVVGQLESNRV
jgi:hypothetical protein